MKMKSALTTLLAGAALVLAACGGATQEPGNTADTASVTVDDGNLLQEVQEEGVLTVGTMGTYQPYSFLNEDGELDGFDVDLSKEVAERLGVEAEFVSQDFSGIIPALQTGKFDMVASQMTITDERQEQMLFSDPYLTNDVKVIVREDNNEIQSVEDFPGNDIGVGLGTNDETFLRNDLMPEVGEFNIRTYDDVLTSLKDLDAGRIDATINNLYALQPIVEANGFEIKAVGEPIKSDQPGLAVRLGNEAFIEEVNQILEEMKADGTYRDIFVKWFNEEPPAE